MPTDHPATNGAPPRFNPPRFNPPHFADERKRILAMTDEERQTWIEEKLRGLEALGEIVDPTDTDELWDEALRNLGVDPATGRGLES